MPLALKILLILLVIVLIVLGVLYYFGTKLQKKQVLQKEQMEAMKQTISMLIIDKKIMKLKDAGLPEIVMKSTPKYLRWSKLPVVKAKVGPRIMTMIADTKVFEKIPVKKECKLVVSGIYITDIKSVRGGSIPQPAPKKRGLARFFKKKDKKAENKK